MPDQYDPFAAGLQAHAMSGEAAFPSPPTVFNRAAETLKDAGLA